MTYFRKNVRIWITDILAGMSQNLERTTKDCLSFFARTL